MPMDQFLAEFFGQNIPYLLLAVFIVVCVMAGVRIVPAGDSEAFVELFLGFVFALLAGRSSPEGVTMGHAGALVHGSHGGFAAKKQALEAAGVTVCASLDAMTSAIAAWHAQSKPE